MDLSEKRRRNGRKNEEGRVRVYINKFEQNNAILAIFRAIWQGRVSTRVMPRSHLHELHGKKKEDTDDFA